jgi:hypothetical protein
MRMKYNSNNSNGGASSSRKVLMERPISKSGAVGQPVSSKRMMPE